MPQIEASIDDCSGSLIETGLLKTIPGVIYNSAFPIYCGTIYANRPLSNECMMNNIPNIFVLKYVLDPGSCRLWKCA
jgi:hypothetical protein